jgi:hypothetical protein
MDNTSFFNLRNHPAKGGDTFHFSTPHFAGSTPVKLGQALAVFGYSENVLLSSPSSQAESWWNVSPEKRGVSVA